MTDTQLSKVEAAIAAYREHFPTGFDCCSAHPVADAAPALVAEIRKLREREAESITYRVQPHDITTLTAPMWDACGIECPAMIGAACPGQFDSRQYMDGPADAAQHAKRCPGKSSKFPNAAAEVVYGWSLSWQPETCGDVDQPIGCNSIFRTPEDERHDDNPMGAGVILSVDSQGSVSLARYFDAAPLKAAWAGLQRQEAAYFRATCEDCTPDTPCADHED